MALAPLWYGARVEALSPINFGVVYPPLQKQLIVQSLKVIQAQQEEQERGSAKMTTIQHRRLEQLEAALLAAQGQCQVRGCDLCLCLLGERAVQRVVGPRWLARKPSLVMGWSFRQGGCLNLWFLASNGAMGRCL